MTSRFPIVSIGLFAMMMTLLTAQAQPKKERIAISEINKAEADPDFSIQGEYEGTSDAADSSTVGSQVIAKGNGEFYIHLLSGGLPGAGWDGETKTTGKVNRGSDGKISVEIGKATGQFANGKLTLTDGVKLQTVLKKVHRSSPTLGKKAPEGAEVLFAGPGDEAKWEGGKIIELSDGKFLNNGIKSKKKYNAFVAHVEFRLPWMPNSTGQGRGNSGVYLQDRYELQILDSFGLKGENNECGGFYTLHKPSVNMCLPPMVWQTYDIEFTPAEFGPDGKKSKNARATVVQNGVKIQDNVELKGPTGGGQPEAPTPGPFQLQNHGDPVVFNNIWVVEKK